MAYYPSYSTQATTRMCGFYEKQRVIKGSISQNYTKTNYIHFKLCTSSFYAYYLCEETEASGEDVPNTAPQNVHFGPLSTDFVINKTSLVICPKHHFSHSFLAIDKRSNCWTESSFSNLITQGRRNAPSFTLSSFSQMSLPPMFLCSKVLEQVSYTLVCDHRRDCSDSSDEDFCVFTPCSGNSSFQCADENEVLYVVS